MGMFGSPTGPTKLNAAKINQSCQGLPLPALCGKHKVQQSLLWLNGFSVQSVSGGKGGGKATGFLYAADAIIGLCEGPVAAVDDVWYNQSWLSNAAGAENVTVPEFGIYTPLGASTFGADAGVAVVSTASITTQDLNAPTPTVLSTSTTSPLKLVPYGTTLVRGQYSFNKLSVDAPFAVTSCGNASLGVTVYTGVFPGGDSNGFAGYTWIIEDFTNPVNNSLSADAKTGYVCTASTATTLTLANAFGVAQTGQTATATEPGNTYHFSSYDAANATPVQISYSFQENNVRAQEIDIIPDSGVVFVGAPYAYGADDGVIYYSSGTDTESQSKNGTALIPVDANPPTEAGTYHFVSSGTGQGGSAYVFAPADYHQEVLITFTYQNNSLIPLDAPSTLNFELFNGAEGQAIWSLLADSYPGEALSYGGTAYGAFQPMQLGASGDVPNITYEVQTNDSYGGGIVDCNPIQPILRVLTDPIWGLGSGFMPFPIECLDIQPGGTWGVPPIIGPAVTSVTPNTITTGPVVVKVYASSGAGWQGLGGTLLSTTTVNTPVFNQVVEDYPILGFNKQPVNNGNKGGGYKLSPMVAVETTSNGTLLDTKALTGTTSTFTMDMTGTFTIPVAGTYTLFVNSANYSSWALYCDGATLIGGTTPPSSTTISTGDGHTPFPTTGPVSGYTKMGEQSKDDGAHPTPATMIVSFAVAGTFNWEAIYCQTEPISQNGEANGYFQITTTNGAAPVGPSGGSGTVGVAVLPTVNAGDVPTATTAYNWFAANGYFISANLDRQENASAVIGKWLEAGSCVGFMSEGLFKLVPYGDTTTIGNGVCWLAPSAYVVALDDSCFLAKDGEEPVKISRKPYADANNYCQVKWSNRQNQYADEVTPEFDQSAIDRFGRRIEAPQDWDFICNLTSATFAAIMRVKRSVNILTSYEFKLPFTYSYLEPMDIVSITTSSLWAQALTANSQLALVAVPVRIIKIVDDPVEGLTITAEDYPYGVGQPVLFNKAINTSAPVTDLYATPGNTEAVLFEPTGRMTANYSGNQIWIGCSGSQSEWGGCNVLVSSDGTKYLPVGTITQQARIGELNTLFPSASDPDENNALIIDLADNCPALDAGTSDDADQGNTLCYVDGEVVAYSDCSLTGSGQFTMNSDVPSVAGYIRRGQLGTTISAHSAGSLFMRLDTSVFKYTYDPVWYGKTIYFKFQSFNKFKNSAQDPSTLTPVSFTIGGSLGAIDAGSGLVLQTQPNSPVFKPIIPPIGIGRLGWAELAQSTTLTPLTFSPTSGYSGPFFTIVGGRFLEFPADTPFSSDSAISSNFDYNGGHFDGFGGTAISDFTSPVTNIGIGEVKFTANVACSKNTSAATGSVQFGIANDASWTAGNRTAVGFYATEPTGSGVLSGTWHIIANFYNAIAGTQSYGPIDTGVKISIANQVLSFTINTAGTVITYFINGAQVGQAILLSPRAGDVTNLGINLGWSSLSFSGNFDTTLGAITLEY